ncbi:ATPase family gene 2 protein homolog A-like [Ochlerotatus camptorhynchus]|uniref:ATPase family gene 2 protein homolog A-like n=1 Tax=Ochlerotatus camptorhynchus TaxID=644619 RepID=UPI0031E255F9
MPPKSAKKDHKSIWWKCEQCRAWTLTAELAKHQVDCKDLDVLTGYITETNEFHSTRFECSQLTGTAEELKEMSDVQLNGLVLLSSAVMNKLELVLGDLVEVNLRSHNTSHVLKFVRCAWPIDEKHGSRVLSAHIDEVPISAHTNICVCIKPFKLKVANVDELTVALSGEKLTTTDEIHKNGQTFMQLIRRQHQGRILSNQNLLFLRLCNKGFSFKIVKILLRNENRDLDCEFKNLSLECRYFKIDRDTKISICSNDTGGPHVLTKSVFNLDNIGGLGATIREIKEIAEIALGQTKAAHAPISRGILLYGVSGSGKTLLVNSLAEYFQCLAIKVDCSEIFSKFYGETEGNIKKIFDKAFINYPSPTIVIIEEIHNICPKADSSDIIKRISNFLVNLMDSLHSSPKAGRILVLGTTDNPDNINPYMRRGGRMDYEFELPVPDAQAREEILSKILLSYKHCLQVEDIKKLSLVTHGYVGADLVSLVGRATHETDSLISYTNMETALQYVKASAMREIMIECPNVHWTDIGGQHDLKLQLRQIIDWPIHRPEIFARLGITAPRGLLMFGPPGCSKTMIAKAIATESKLNFLSIKGSELFSMWVGESERAVRELFRKARQVAPSIIFFDEIDAIGGERSAESGSSVKERVLAQILTEIDGVSVLKNVKIIAATNRPDLIDKALMRPGRLDRIIYVRLPDHETRKEIFKIKLSKIPVATDVDIDNLVARSEGYSGSEIEAICQEAVLKALEDSFDSTEISQKYFDHALFVVKPRTSAELLQLYDNYLKQQQH